MLPIFPTGIALGYTVPLAITSLQPHMSLDHPHSNSAMDDLRQDHFRSSGAVPDFYDIVGPHCGANFCPYLPDGSLSPESIRHDFNMTFSATVAVDNRTIKPSSPQVHKNALPSNDTIVTSDSLHIQVTAVCGRLVR